MSALLEELDYRPTPIGAVSLRRRKELRLAIDVFEIKLGDEFLTSSPFTASEIALTRLAKHLRPGGVFDLWSNDRPDNAFSARLAAVFTDARAEEATFHNPLQDRPFTQTIYLGRRRT